MTHTEQAVGSAVQYRADDILPAIERARLRNCDRLMLANRIGFVIEIMADDLEATILALQARADKAERELKNAIQETHELGEELIEKSEALSTITTERDAMRETLKPFADVGRALDMDGTVAKILWPDDLRIKSPTAHVSGVNYFITAGNFRAAAKALPSGHQAVKSPSPTPPAEGD
jgi:hypothetical protein